MSASPVEADELDVQYQSVFGEVSGIIDAARRSGRPFGECRHDRCLLAHRTLCRGV